MTLASMTGFARWSGAAEPWRLVWEIKTVNSKGLDLRLRTPPQFDAIEPEARRRIGARLARGACQATLTATREAAAADVRVNADILARLVAAVQAV
ncbi:MAG: hypothetical protein JNK46_16815, partial [Methylobacteriaceae bacterium]|nr:hypothetical protein [Methylobacteriaceae bacterium]